MYKNFVLLFLFVGVLTFVGIASGVVAVQPVFHTTLNDAASVTSTGGVITGDGVFVATSEPAGSVAKFQGAGNSTAEWDGAATDAIFGGWDKTLGITVDLYFSGIGETGHDGSGDVGLWSVGKRLGGDNFLILVAREDELRLNIRDEGGAGDIGGSTHTILTDGVDLNPDTTYRLTVRQHSSLGTSGDLQIFLESISDGGAQYAATDVPIRSLALTGGNFRFPIDEGSGSDPLRMHIGDKYPFGDGIRGLENGDAIDNVRVFNGVYLPSELGTIPEPCTLLLLGAGAVGLLRRRRS
jgi:hypothetical protein